MTVSRLILIISFVAVAGSGASAAPRLDAAVTRHASANLQPTPVAPAATRTYPAPCLRYEATVRACAERHDEETRRRVILALDQQAATWADMPNQPALAAACEMVLRQFESERPSMGC